MVPGQPDNPLSPHEEKPVSEHGGFATPAKADPMPSQGTDTASLKDVLVTEALSQRPPRPADPGREVSALHALARHLADEPKSVLQHLVTLAVELCHAGSAGVSLLETLPHGEKIFRWVALAGRVASYVGESTPADWSPCGTCLHYGTSVLFSYPARHFTYFSAVSIPIVEGLIIPLYAGDQTLGTIWVWTHDETRKFDREDVRVMTSLANFTAAALQLKGALAATEAERTRLQRSEEKLQFQATMLQNVRDSVIFTDLAGKILYWNEGARQIFGYTAEEALGKTLALLNPDQSQEEIATQLKSILEGNDYHGAWQGRRKDGTRIWVDVRTTVMRDAQGQPIGFLGIFQDITERRRTERRLAGQHALTRILSDAATLAEAAPKLLQAIGESLGSELGTLWCVDREAQALRCVEVWQARATAFPAFEAASRHRTFAPGIGMPGRVWACGKPVWVTDIAQETNFPRATVALGEGLHGAFSFPIQLGSEILGVVEFFYPEIQPPDEALLRMTTAMGRQIGQFMERTQAEEALRDREERLTMAQSAAGMGLWDWDPQTQTGRCSKECFALYGLEPRDVLTEAEWAACVHTEDLERVYQECADSLVHGGTYHLEYRVVRPNDGIHWLASQGKVFLNAAGKAVRMMGVVWDITDRQEAEAERRRLLERERAARQEAEVANRLKDEFLATLSHELRTPLNAMLGWTRLLRAGSLDAATTQIGLRALERNAKAQTQIINDILDVSRIITGKVRLDIHPLDLSQVVQEALETIRPAADAKAIHLEWVRGANVGLISGDPARLQQVLWNLLSNAVKFTPERGHIEVRIERVERAVEIRVRDNGQGIGADFLPFVFERFRQADSSSTRAYGGLGLGLAIVRHLVELHGGTVSVQSPGEGQGTTATVRLPLTVPRLEAGRAWPAPSTPSRSSLAGQRPNLEGVHVLLVDDDPDGRASLALWLQQCGAQVTTAASAAKALATVATAQPDVLISDIAMPGEDGVTLIRKIRALPPEQGGQIPAIALTRYAGTEDRQQVLQAGYQAHRPKPVDPDELTGIIASLMGRTGQSSASGHEG